MIRTKIIHRSCRCQPWDTARLGAVLTLAIPILTVVLHAGPVFGERPGESPGGKLPERWPYWQQVKLPEQTDSPWIDLVLPRSVFGAARYDLADLRLYDRSGTEIHCALRVLRSERQHEKIEAKPFNRAGGPDDSSELWLDLGENQIGHNEVEVKMPGVNFRRRAELEASDDAKQWRTLVKRKDLIHFQSGEDQIKDCRLSYPPSRYRYLRVRVFPDPEFDKKPSKIDSVIVQRRIDLPGEMIVHKGKLGGRQPVRTDRRPSSAWVVELGGENLPVDRVEVDVEDVDFVRPYQIEAAGPPDSEDPFRVVATGTWQRRAAQEPKPLVARFGEVRASRLRLTIIDHANDPLEVRSVTFIAPARQVVFATPEKLTGSVRLVYGNAKAEDPHYDFAGNLPLELKPSPTRATLGARLDNPTYVPEPLPFTERWPWAIYVVLGSISLLLGAVIISVARSAIAVHDAAGNTTKVP